MYFVILDFEDKLDETSFLVFYKFGVDIVSFTRILCLILLNIKKFYQAVTIFLH